MKVPLSWLKEYVEVDIPVKELAERLTLAGMEVEAVEAIGYPEAELPWDREKVIVGEVLAVRPHPDADRLVLAEVNYGGAQTEIVVTGAPSLYERKGQEELHLKVAFAWEGATLYDGHAEGLNKKKLKGSKIRGVPSRAMVCSEKELGLTDEQTDIIYLPAEIPVGTPLVDILGDYVIGFDIKGPFGHLQSVYGIARETAALLGKPLRRTPLQAGSRLGIQTVAQTDFIDLEIADPDLCPRYTATLIENVKIGPSPLWMQLRLRRVGMRPINNIVDITNYVMLELGQPLHAFDYAHLHSRPDGHTPAIIIRRAAPGEQMHTLDGELRTFDGQMLLITDGAGPVAVGGVMGGLDSEVEATTQTVLLEAAAFNFLNVRRTAQTLKLFTESAARFGKRVDSDLPELAAARAAELMHQLAGGTVRPTMGDLYPGKTAPLVIEYKTALADRLLGVVIPPEDQKRILAALEFKVVDNGAVWQVTVPAHRQDVRRPVDLVEDVARVYGYDHFPRTLIRDPLPPLRRNFALEGEEHVRDLLARLGLDEIISYSLIDPVNEAKLNRTYAGEAALLRNSLAPERSQMRRTLFTGLLTTAWSNLRYLDRIAIFEVGRVHLKVGAPEPEKGITGVAEPRHLGILLTGPREGNNWQATDRSPMDYFDLKGIVEAFLKSLGLEAAAKWERGDDPSLHPGRCARVSLGDKVLGVMGELHPRLRAAFDLPDQPVVILEWDLDTLLSVVNATDKKVDPLSTFAPVHEDLAIVVDEATPALDVQRTLIQAGYPMVKQALLFDIYRGPQVGENRKSLAFALTYQAPDRPLSDEDAEKIRQRIIKRLKDVGGTLRGA